MAATMASELVEARRRSQSRASTSSMHSGSTLPNLEHSFPELYSATPWLDDSHDHSQHNNTHAHHQHAGQMMKAGLGGVHPLTPEDIILQAASQLEANGDFSGLDASMTTSVGGTQSFHHHASGLAHQHALPGDTSFGADASFGDLDSQMELTRDGNEDGDSSLTAGLPASAPKPSRSSANNELEMRQLFTANKARSLQDVAEELHGNERGPNSERTRQVFAMLW